MKTALPDLKLEIKSGTPPVSRMTPLDISRARDELGWEPSFTLESALATYAEEFRMRNA